MTSLHPAAIKAVAEVLYANYRREHDASHLSWLDFTDDAKRVIEAVLPHLMPDDEADD